MDLSEIDTQLAQAATRRDKLQQQHEATSQLRDEAGAQLTLGGERYRQMRVDALASGQDLNGAGDALRQELDALRDAESMHMRQLDDLEEAVRQVTGNITRLRQMRETQIRSEIYPAYQQFMDATAADLIKALAMRLIPVARVMGVAPAGTNYTRVFEKVMEGARRDGSWDQAVQTAITEYKQEMGA